MGEPSPSATVSPEAKQQAVGGQPVLPHAGRLGRVVKNALGRGSSTGQKLLPRSPKKRANREKSSSSIGSPGDAVTPTAKQQNTESSPIKLTPSAVAAGIAQGARSLAAGVASLGARALGGGSSPMVADAAPARSSSSSPSQVPPLEQEGPSSSPPPPLTQSRVRKLFDPSGADAGPTPPTAAKPTPVLPLSWSEETPTWAQVVCYLISGEPSAPLELEPLPPLHERAYRWRRAAHARLGGGQLRLGLSPAEARGAWLCAGGGSS